MYLGLFLITKFMNVVASSPCKYVNVLVASFLDISTINGVEMELINSVTPLLDIKWMVFLLKISTASLNVNFLIV